MQEKWVEPWVGKTPWRRAWQPTPVFLAGKSHGQRSLTGYTPEGCKEWDTTERLTLSLFKESKGDFMWIWKSGMGKTQKLEIGSKVI